MHIKKIMRATVKLASTAAAVLANLNTFQHDYLLSNASLIALSSGPMG